MLDKDLSIPQFGYLSGVPEHVPSSMEEEDNCLALGSPWQGHKAAPGPQPCALVAPASPHLVDTRAQIQVLADDHNRSKHFRPGQPTELYYCSISLLVLGKGQQEAEEFPVTLSRQSHHEGTGEHLHPNMGISVNTLGALSVSALALLPGG